MPLSHRRGTYDSCLYISAYIHRAEKGVFILTIGSLAKKLSHPHRSLALIRTLYFLNQSFLPSSQGIFVSSRFLLRLVFYLEIRQPVKKITREILEELKEHQHCMVLSKRFTLGVNGTNSCVQSKLWG